MRNFTTRPPWNTAGYILNLRTSHGQKTKFNIVDCARTMQSHGIVLPRLRKFLPSFPWIFRYSHPITCLTCKKISWKNLMSKWTRSFRKAQEEFTNPLLFWLIGEQMLKLVVEPDAWISHPSLQSSPLHPLMENYTPLYFHSQLP